MKESSDETVLFGVSDVARELNYSEDTVRRRADRGLIPVAAKTSYGERLFHPADISRLRKRPRRKLA